ncbi:signal peptide containing protein [Theileria equi strain WA]|uniref:Signal peptide containing protein n=1 Tax=Theileria equi strain WA TaxID=1537102 RepID=L1LAT8_THEEQ|nr:signal peptide containing protein [Theileria equi strain WA]EKX72374.1 signal peptide containing protein [Theileria equi strain WA]|eukprot:XP_004831826.1 signal peptide containing protein [Theileria equi strain WA]
MNALAVLSFILWIHKSLSIYPVLEEEVGFVRGGIENANSNYSYPQNLKGRIPPTLSSYGYPEENVQWTVDQSSGFTKTPYGTINYPTYWENSESKHVPQEHEYEVCTLDRATRIRGASEPTIKREDIECVLCTVGNGIKTGVSYAIETGKAVVECVKPYVCDFVEAGVRHASNFLEEKAPTLHEGLTYAAPIVKGVVKGTAKVTAKVATAATNYAVEKAPAVGEAIIDVTTDALNYVCDAVPVVKDKIISGATNAVDSTKDYIAEKAPIVRDKILDGAAFAMDNAKVYIAEKAPVVRDRILDGANFAVESTKDYIAEKAPIFTDKIVSGANCAVYSARDYISENVPVVAGKVLGGINYTGKVPYTVVPTAPPMYLDVQNTGTYAPPSYRRETGVPGLSYGKPVPRNARKASHDLIDEMDYLFDDSDPGPW